MPGCCEGVGPVHPRPHELPPEHQQCHTADHHKGDEAGHVQQLSLPVGITLGEHGLQLKHQGRAEAQGTQCAQVEGEGGGGAAI